ncbi:ABC transporter ATP-binding protein/permease [Candidatus Pelagibacter sp.]|nr:ABC transporter ATP-binding protein/permease [Candidatus Pelagibacter sp.]
MKDLIFFLKFQKKTKIIFIIFLLSFGTFLDLFGLSLIIPTIKVISDYENLSLIIKQTNILNPLIKFSQNQLIIFFLTVFLLINVFKGLIFVYLNWKTNQFAKEVNQQISEKLINFYSYISYEEIVNKSSSSLIRNITEEVEGVSSAVLNFLNMIVDLFVMLCIFCFILYIEPGGVLLISFILILGLFVFRRLLVKRLIKWGYERQKYYLKKIKNINEIFHSYSELKILKKINFFGKNYLKYNNEYFNNVIKYGVTQIIPRFLVESLAVVGVTFSLIYLLIFNDNQEQILYALAVLGASSLRILPSINRVINLYNSFKFSSASLELVRNEIEGLKQFINIKNEEIDNLKFESDIKIKNISYNYPGKLDSTLKNIDFVILKNQIIGIKGETGSGKSTLLKILIGLIKPKNGSLCVDNIDIYKNQMIESWFRKIAYVPQDIYLIDETIKENILFGCDHKNFDKKLYELSMEVSECNKFVKNLENKDKTFVGENGLKLSGGQKQRIGIARAIYLNREILILDEATNSLDETTEKKIINNILKLKNKPTIIFVSHKSSNFQICDKIFDLSKQEKN